MQRYDSESNSQRVYKRYKQTIKKSLVIGMLNGVLKF